MECQKELNRWRAEHAVWLTDIKKWKRQEQQVLVALFKLEQAMPDHGRLLNEHADAIRKHEKKLDDIKKHLAKYQDMDIDDKTYAEWMNTQMQGREQHAEVEHKHAEMRLNHLAAMSELSVLAKLLIPDKEE